MIGAVIGIDPGKTGGIAIQAIKREGIYKTTGKYISIEAFKMPETERDLWELMQVLDEWSHPICAFLERVHSMPKQGVASSFKFGTNYGMLRAFLVAIEIPFELITPSVWQRKMGCLSKGDKNVTKARAQELFPKIKVTHAIADALLISEYGRRVLIKQGGMLRK